MREGVSKVTSRNVVPKNSTAKSLVIAYRLTLGGLMKTWHQARMVDASAALAAFDKLQQAFMAQAISERGAVPHGRGVFVADDPTTNNVIWYFSPEAKALAEIFGGQPCEKPVPNKNFSLLVGEQRSAMLYFPEYFNRAR